MAKPQSRQELIDYCLRNLGAPVIKINIDEDQLDDRFDEALQFYQEYHSDAVVRTFVKHQITQDDIDRNYIELPEELISVFRVFPISTSSVGGTDMFSMKYQMYMNDLWALNKGRGSLIDYEMTKQYLGLIDMTINGMCQQIRFSRHLNRLHIEVDWEETGLTLDKYIVIEGYQTINPDQFTDVYNDMMLKRYLTALIKKNWGSNLIKFEGVQLPGGVTISGRAIYDDAVNELTKLEEEFQDRYSFPPDFYCG